MNILFTADLHLNIPAYNRRTGFTMLQSFVSHVEKENPDVVVVTGDIASPMQAAHSMGLLRQAAGERTLAVAHGNHDFWLDCQRHESVSCLDDVVENYWVNPVRDDHTRGC